MKYTKRNLVKIFEERIDTLSKALFEQRFKNVKHLYQKNLELNLLLLESFEPRHHLVIEAKKSHDKHQF